MKATAEAVLTLVAQLCAVEYHGMVVLSQPVQGEEVMVM